MHGHPICCRVLNVGIFLKGAELGGAVYKAIIIPSQIFAGQRTVLEKRGDLPACRNLEPDRRGALALPRNVKEQHGEIEEAVFLIQNAAKRRLAVKVHVVADDQLGTPLPAKTPRV